jgi:nitronate monooxygenase
MPLAGTVMDVVRYAVFSPKPGFTGDLDYLALYAGESCSLVHTIKPAAQIVRDVMREAEGVIAQIKGP